MKDINVNNITKKHEDLIKDFSTILAFSETKEVALKELSKRNIKVGNIIYGTGGFFGWFIELEKEIDLTIYFNSELKILELGIESSEFYEVVDNIKKSDKFFKGVF